MKAKIKNKNSPDIILVYFHADFIGNRLKQQHIKVKRRFPPGRQKLTLDLALDLQFPGVFPHFPCFKRAKMWQIYI